MSTLPKVYITFHPDRTIDRVFATWRHAADYLIACWVSEGAYGGSPERRETAAMDHIAVEEVLP